MKKTRADVVRAMDIMISCINDENYIDTWLALGVADCDIKAETTNEEIEMLGYTDDKTFKELMTLFLNLMNKASANGLYCDNILSGHKVISWTE